MEDGIAKRPVLGPGTIVNGYEILGLIGQGGFADIYKVMSIKFAKIFAAKIIYVPESQAKSTWNSFSVEVNSLMKMDHPNIIKLYDSFKYDKSFVIILEYCQKGSLMDEIERYGRMHEDKFIPMFRQITSALEYAHHQKLAHHDIKPQNILFDSFGRAKLADFGISLQMSFSVLSDDFKCSMAYAPPEVIAKKLHSPYQADIWSLGITLIYALTRDLPYDSYSAKSIKYSISTGNFNFRSPIPRQYLQLIKGMLVKSPAQRISIEEISQFAQNLEDPEESLSLKSSRQGSAISLVNGLKTPNMLLQTTSTGHKRRNTMITKGSSSSIKIIETFRETILE